MLRIPGDASRDFCVTCYACHMVITWIIMPWKIGIPVYDRNTLGTAVSASLCAPGDMECLVKHFPFTAIPPGYYPFGLSSWFIFFQAGVSNKFCARKVPQ